MTTKISRRMFLGSSLAAGGTLALTGCNLLPGGGGGDGSGEIRFSSYGDPEKLQIRGSLADVYSEQHPDVTVTFEGSPTQDYWDRLATQMSAGNAPDVINIDTTRIGQYGGRGALSPLESYVPDVIQTEYFDELLLQTGAIDDVLYGVPVATATWGMGYNADALDELGIEHPDGSWTWEDYAEYSIAIADAADGSLTGSGDESGNLTILELWLRSRDNALYTEDRQDLGFSEQTLSEWFDYWAALRADGGCVSAEDAAQFRYGDWPNSPIATGRAVMTPLSTANLIGGFQSFTRDRVEMTLAPRGTSDGEHPHFAGASSYLSLNASSESPDEAAHFLNWFANSAEAALTLRLISGPPASSAGREALLAESGLDEEEERVLNFTELALAAATAPPPPAPPAGSNVNDLFYLASQDIAFARDDAAAVVANFMSEASRALSS